MQYKNKRKVFTFAVPHLPGREYFTVAFVVDEGGQKRLMVHPDQSEHIPIAELGRWFSEMKEAGLRPAYDLNRPGLIEMVPPHASDLEARLAFEFLLIEAGVDLPNRTM